MLGRIDVPRSEEDGECGERERDDEGRVETEDGEVDEGRRPQQRLDRNRSRLELERNVRKRAEHRHDRRDGRDGLALAVSGGDEVGDGREVLALRDPDDAQDQRHAEDEHQDRTEIDRNEVVAARCREADAAEERPGCTVDRQRQGVGDRAAAASLARANDTIAEPRHGEEQADIAERQRQDLPGFDHRAAAPMVPRRASVQPAAKASSCFGCPERATEP